jgi:23S rRNA pseudouridine1911/1915/1917 synthase
MSESTPLRRLVVEEEGDGIRLDVFLADYLEDVSRSRIQKLVKTDQILVDENPCKSSQALREGQTITWPADAGVTTIEVLPEPIPLQILYEDDHLMVLHKPPNMVVHPAPGNWTGTLVHGLLHHWPSWPQPPGGALRPGIVHRLDKDTSGLMVVARTVRAYDSLCEQFAVHSIERRYVTLVWGHPGGQSGVIEKPIGRDPVNRQRMAIVGRGGKPARSNWEVLTEFDFATLLRVALHTGRTHQVRVHLSSIGHPVFGDETYGGVERINRLLPKQRPPFRGLLRRLNRFALHAYHLGFRHPADDGWLAFEAPVPEDMESVLLSMTKSGGAE